MGIKGAKDMTTKNCLYDKKHSCHEKVHVFESYIIHIYEQFYMYEH